VFRHPQHTHLGCQFFFFFFLDFLCIIQSLSAQAYSTHTPGLPLLFFLLPLPSNRLRGQSGRYREFETKFCTANKKKKKKKKAGGLVCEHITKCWTARKKRKKKKNQKAGGQVCEHITKCSAGQLGRRRRRMLVPRSVNISQSAGQLRRRRRRRRRLVARYVNISQSAGQLGRRRRPKKKDAGAQIPV
jgi:hypothetical protein